MKNSISNEERQLFLNLMRIMKEKTGKLIVDDNTSSKTQVINISQENRNYRVYAIDKNQQKAEDFKSLLALLLKTTGQSNSIQLFGDSAHYGKSETKFCLDFLENHLLKTFKNSLIFYGFTGHLANNDRLDVNELLNELLIQSPQLSNRVIANLVEHHSYVAIKNWGCSFSKRVRNFFLVYDKNEKNPVRFGDDIISSDSLTNHRGLCLEGGIQSFHQAINLIINEVHVDGISNLRGVNNKWCNLHTYNKSAPDKDVKFFSSAEFLNFMLIKLNDATNPTEEQAEQFKNKYMEDRLLYNPERDDADTKQALFNHAWKKFIKQEVWKKLPEFYHGFEYNSEKRCAVEVIDLAKRVTSEETQNTFQFA